MFQSTMQFKKEAVEKALKCVLCCREAEEKDFCNLHLRALNNIIVKYEVWRKALKISWKEYLKEIGQNSLTGEWVKEVADLLIKNEGLISVEES